MMYYVLCIMYFVLLCMISLLTCASVRVLQTEWFGFRHMFNKNGLLQPKSSVMSHIFTPIHHPSLPITSHHWPPRRPKFSLAPGALPPGAAAKKPPRHQRGDRRQSHAVAVCADGGIWRRSATKRLGFSAGDVFAFVCAFVCHGCWHVSSKY